MPVWRARTRSLDLDAPSWNLTYGREKPAEQGAQVNNRSKKGGLASGSAASSCDGVIGTLFPGRKGLLFRSTRGVAVPLFHFIGI